MTDPADLPPPGPDEGNNRRRALGWGLIAAAFVFVLAASILIGPHVHYSWIPGVIVAAVAIVLVAVGIVVLYHAGRPS